MINVDALGVCDGFSTVGVNPGAGENPAGFRVGFDVLTLVDKGLLAGVALAVDVHPVLPFAALVRDLFCWRDSQVIQGRLVLVGTSGNLGPTIVFLTV